MLSQPYSRVSRSPLIIINSTLENDYVQYHACFFTANKSCA
jgi:hypothetical protein